MPIPGSILNQPLIVSSVIDLYPSRATFMPMTKGTDTTGQETHTFVLSSDPLLSNLPCRRSPLIIIRPQNAEALEAGNIQRSDIKSQVNFPLYIAVNESVLLQWQISIDGIVYQIKSVESDGGKVTTRLMISDEVPFVA
jgi:hypothetical protein